MIKILKPLETLFTWYGKRNVLIVLGILTALLVSGLFLSLGSDNDTEPQTARLPIVEVETVSQLSNQANLVLLGQVEAVDQADLKSDVGGRIVAVNASLGESVEAGAVIIELENSVQRAAVLQAEGAYEAALAAAAQSELGVDQANNNLAKAENELASVKNDIGVLYKSSFNTTNQIILQNIDDFYRNPLVLQPIVLIDSRTYTNFLENTRIELRSILKDWQEKAANPDQYDPEELLNEIRNNATIVNSVLDAFIDLLSRTNGETLFTDSELDSALTTFIANKATLNSIISDIETKRTALSNANRSLLNAQNAFEQAQIGGSQTGNSAAEAQVKQALGSLRNAQANLAKTIIRTPISGVVNSLDARVGDFIAPQTNLGFVANNNALEITTYVGQADLDLISIGQEVLIENGERTGIVTNISPSLNPVTKKVEVKISSEDENLKNGDTVNISISNEFQNQDLQRIMVPITAVKFTQNNGSVFMVENGELVSKDVEIGRVEGSSVEIISGILPSDEILIDVRGKATGQKVEILSN